MKLPSFIGDLTDPGEVRKLNRPDETELPTILGGRDGCQARASNDSRTVKTEY